MYLILIRIFVQGQQDTDVSHEHEERFWIVRSSIPIMTSALKAWYSFKKEKSRTPEAATEKLKWALAGGRLWGFEETRTKLDVNRLGRSWGVQMKRSRFYEG